MLALRYCFGPFSPLRRWVSSLLRWRFGEDAARIRAQTGLATPDALHAATALSVDCTLFVTNDTDFRRVQGLPVAVLDDLVEV